MGKIKDDEGDPLIPTPAQLNMQAAVDRGCENIFNLWGRRGTKSSAMAIEGTTEMDYGPIGNLPMRNIQISGYENDVTDNIFEYMYKWIVDEQILGYAPLYKSVRSRYIQMPWGSRVDGRNTIDPTSLLGKGLVLALVDEHARDDPEILDKYITPPTIDVGGRVIIATTPLGKSNHASKTYKAWTELAKTDPLYHTSRFTSYDNPHNKRYKIEQYKKQCIAKGRYQIFLQEIMAELTALSGAVFEHFQPERNGLPWHVVENLQPVEGVPLTCGVDWGTRHPYAFLIIQIYGDGRVRVLREVHVTGLGISGQSERSQQAITEFRDDHGDFPIDLVYPDPSLLGAIVDWEKYGWPMFRVPGEDRIQYTSFHEGAATLNQLFSADVDGPIIEIDASCVNVIEQLESMVWSDDPNSERPKKERDDAFDGLRYPIQGALGLEDREPVLFAFG